MKYDEDEIAYNLAREEQEIALSQASGGPEMRAVHREMARLYGSRARDGDSGLVAPSVSMETPV